MACFLVPATEAIVTTVITKAADKKEPEHTSDHVEAAEVKETSHKMPFVRKLRWLSNMLWGGAVLLCFEHLWHGEVVPFPPFLTAASNPADTAEMLGEMSTVGVCMAVLITAVWVGMVIVTGIIDKRGEASETSQEV